jgi:hypothetical protein
MANYNVDLNAKTICKDYKILRIIMKEQYKFKKRSKKEFVIL